MATLYQKRGNEYIPIEFPAEMISVASEKFQATDTKGALEELESKFSEMYATEGTRQAAFTQDVAQEFTWPWDSARRGYFRALEVTPLADGIIGDMDPDIVTLGADHKTFTVNESGFYFVKVRGAWSFNKENAPEEVMCSIRIPAFNLDFVSSTSGSNGVQAWFNNSVLYYFEKGTQVYFELVYPGNHITNPVATITSVTQSVMVQWVKMPTVNKLEKNKYSGGEWGQYLALAANMGQKPSASSVNYFQVSFTDPDSSYVAGENHRSFELTEDGIKILEDGQYSFTSGLVIVGSGITSLASEEIMGAWASVVEDLTAGNTVVAPNIYASIPLKAVPSGSPTMALSLTGTFKVKKNSTIIITVFIRPSVAIPIHHLSIHVERIQEPAALSIPDPADYTFDPVTGGHRGLIPDIPAKDRGIMNRPLVTMGGASTNIDVRNVSCVALDTEADNTTGGLTLYNKEGYAKEIAGGLSVKQTLWGTIVPNRGENKGTIEGDYFVKTMYSPLSQTHMASFWENFNNGSVGLHWCDPETGVEQINRQIIRLPIGYACRPVDLDDVNVADCPIGMKVRWGRAGNIVLPAIGSWDYCIYNFNTSGQMVGFTAGIAPGGYTLFTNDLNKISTGFARRIA